MLQYYRYQHLMRNSSLCCAKILADNCDQDFDKVMKDFNRDYWMDAQESIDYGIVDAIYK